MPHQSGLPPQFYGDGSQMPLPPEEQTAEPNLLKRLLLKLMPAKGDVALPLESGNRDPRLPAPTQMQAIQESLETVRGLGRTPDAASAAMQALQRRR